MENAKQVKKYQRRALTTGELFTALLALSQNPVLELTLLKEVKTEMNHLVAVLMLHLKTNRLIVIAKPGTDLEKPNPDYTLSQIKQLTDAAIMELWNKDKITNAQLDNRIMFYPIALAKSNRNHYILAETDSSAVCLTDSMSDNPFAKDFCQQLEKEVFFDKPPKQLKLKLFHATRYQGAQEFFNDTDCGYFVYFSIKQRLDELLAKPSELEDSGFEVVLENKKKITDKDVAEVLELIEKDHAKIPVKKSESSALKNSLDINDFQDITTEDNDGFEVITTDNIDEEKITKQAEEIILKAYLAELKKIHKSSEDTYYSSANEAVKNVKFLLTLLESYHPETFNRSQLNKMENYDENSSVIDNVVLQLEALTANPNKSNENTASHSNQNNNNNMN